MIAFVSIAAAMVVAALVWVLVPLLRGPRARGVVGEASNVAILRDQLAELDTDVANGIVSRDQYEQSRRELEQRVLEESKAAPGGAGSGVPSSAAATGSISVGTASTAAAASGSSAASAKSAGSTRRAIDLMISAAARAPAAGSSSPAPPR